MEKPKKKSRNKLYGSMNLNETVADGLYDRINTLYNSPNRGAITKTKLDRGGESVDAFVVGAILEDDMVAYFGKKPKDPEFGEFTAALNNGNIKAAMIGTDIDNGFIGIITDRESLEEIQEYSFIGDVPLHVAAIAEDVNEADGMFVYDTTVAYPDLFNIMNGHKSIRPTEDAESDDTEDFEVVDSSELPEETETETNTYVEDTPVFDNDADESVVFDADKPFDDYDEDQPVFEEEEELSDDSVAGYENISEEDLFDEGSVYNDDDEADADEVFGSEYHSPVYEEAEVPKQREVLSIDEENRLRLLEQKKLLESFNDPDLRLSTDIDDFKTIFNSDIFPIPHLSEDVDDENDELSIAVAKIAQQYNHKIEKYYSERIQKYEREYQLILDNYRDNLAASLDDKNPETDTGKRALAIKDEAQKAYDEVIESRKRAIDEYHSDYDRRKDEYIEQARMRAAQEFDLKHKAEMESVINNTGHDEAKTVRQAVESNEMYNLYNDRRVTAQSYMNKARSRSLATFNNRINTLMDEVSAMYDTAEETIESYIKKHYADEVIRAQSIRDALLRDNQLEELKSQYNTAISAREAELEARMAEKEKEVAKRLAEKSDEIESIKSEGREALSLKEKLIADLEKDLEEAKNGITKADERVAADYENRMKVRDDQNQALQYQISQIGETSKQSDRMKYLLALVLCALGLTIGIIGTYLSVSSIAENRVKNYQTELVKRDDVITDLRKDVDKLELKDSTGK